MEKYFEERGEKKIHTVDWTTSIEGEHLRESWGLPTLKLKVIALEI